MQNVLHRGVNPLFSIVNVITEEAQLPFHHVTYTRFGLYILWLSRIILYLLTEASDINLQ